MRDREDVCRFIEGFSGTNRYILDYLLEEVLASPSTSTLAYLKRANLFLVPLDDDRQWYRYHHHFAGLLRSWLEQAGMSVEAINHSLAAGENDHAARLVEENTIRLLGQGEMNTLTAWIETLPVELRQSRPWLCVHQAYALMLSGRLAEVPPLLL
jgi:LuxR family maltose regulon positive regulatory protein